MAAGMTHADAVENATQRGETSTAVAGSIASAVYVLAKSLAKGEMPTSGRSVPTSQRTAETLDQVLGERDHLGRRRHAQIPHHAGQDLGDVTEPMAPIGASPCLSHRLGPGGKVVAAVRGAA
jgi:hypothetical protein